MNVPAGQGDLFGVWVSTRVDRPALSNTGSKTIVAQVSGVGAKARSASSRTTEHVRRKKVPPPIHSSDPPVLRRSGIGWLLLVFLVAAAARTAWGVYRMLHAPDPYALEFPDELDYWSLARSLALGEGLVGEHGYRALRMPLYPTLLSFFAGAPQGVAFARIAQWLVGSAAAVLVAVLGAKVCDRRTGTVAGLLVAIDPFLILLSSL